MLTAREQFTSDFVGIPKKAFKGDETVSCAGTVGRDRTRLGELERLSGLTVRARL